MRSLLLHIQDDDCFEARLQVALDIGRAFGSHLTCVQPIPYDFSAPGDLYGTMAAELLPTLRDNAAKLQTRIEARLADEGVPWNWVQQLDAAGRLLLAHAALSDLVVLGARELGGGKGASGLAGQIAIHANTPVLAVPENARGFDVATPAVVAWNGSVESSHALRAAVPLLKRASAVFLVSVEEQREAQDYDLPPTEGAEFLSRHGIACEMVDLPQQDGSISGALRQAAEVRKAGCLVTGAYGHSRLREVVLGGTTRGLLRDPAVPLFLCH
jgi:nucleotide-binding universal stress UspA family protein